MHGCEDSPGPSTGGLFLRSTFLGTYMEIDGNIMCPLSKSGVREELHFCHCCIQNAKLGPEIE